MVALLIVSLLSMCIATGVAFGARQYRRAVANSEARILCSTLTNAITDELSNTTIFDSSDSSKTLQANADGQICREDGSLLLPEAAYTGTETLSATIKVTYADADKKYKIELAVSPNNTDWKVETKFDVLPLNPVTVKESH